MSAHSSPAGPRPPTLPGRSLVAGLVLLGLAAAVTGIAYQRMQTRRCLGFYGPDVAQLVTSAPRVELLTLRPGTVAGRLEVRSVRDISAARGLVHLRRGLVEDANFSWAEPQARGRLADEAWDVALVFSDPASPRPPVALVVDFDEGGGSLAVVGRPGRIGLGRIAHGLATWLAGL